MLNMTYMSKKYLEKNLPQSLSSEDIGETLRMLYDLVDEKGFAPPNYDEYNDFGREAWKAYDDLYLRN